ncbi:hypothetical protein [Candidatus Ichthyocystis hellenicum]|uniref:hypothetical protein n=1 Tax=Candidatus Ichthyocystis hellenicum TaxID=1561003 RepID=UPI000A534854|nr:hypothetical protein [Candidatus Ichthyocystis hellenicum]
MGLDSELGHNRGWHNGELQTSPDIFHNILKWSAGFLFTGGVETFPEQVSEVAYDSLVDSSISSGSSHTIFENPGAGVPPPAEPENPFIEPVDSSVVVGQDGIELHDFSADLTVEPEVDPTLPYEPAVVEVTEESLPTSTVYEPETELELGTTVWQSTPEQPNWRQRLFNWRRPFQYEPLDSSIEMEEIAVVQGRNRTLYRSNTVIRDAGLRSGRQVEYIQLDEISDIVGSEVVVVSENPTFDFENFEPNSILEDITAGRGTDEGIEEVSLEPEINSAEEDAFLEGPLREELQVKAQVGPIGSRPKRKRQSSPEGDFTNHTAGKRVKPTPSPLNPSYIVFEEGEFKVPKKPCKKKKVCVKRKGKKCTKYKLRCRNA